MIVSYDAGGGSDILQLAAGISADQLWFQRTNADGLAITVVWTTDSVTIRGWFDSPNFKFDGIALADGSYASTQDIAALVSAMSAFSPRAVGEAPLDQAHIDALAASWHAS